MNHALQPLRQAVACRALLLQFQLQRVVLPLALHLQSAIEFFGAMLVLTCFASNIRRVTQNAMPLFFAKTKFCENEIGHFMLRDGLCK